jgi:type I restriction enzyme M protein
MAVTQYIGHDKRGNTIFRRTETGDDILVSRQEMVREIDPATGKEVSRPVVVKERATNDELPEVAESYLEWLASLS